VVYFLIWDIPQMINNKLGYLKEPFNIINLTVTVLLFVNCLDEDIDTA